MVHGKSYVGIVFYELFIMQLFGQKYRKIMNNCEYINPWSTPDLFIAQRKKPIDEGAPDNDIHEPLFTLSSCH